MATSPLLLGRVPHLAHVWRLLFTLPFRAVALIREKQAVADSSDRPCRELGRKDGNHVFDSLLLWRGPHSRFGGRRSGDDYADVERDAHRAACGRSSDADSA